MNAPTWNFSFTAQMRTAYALPPICQRTIVGQNQINWMNLNWKLPANIPFDIIASIRLVKVCQNSLRFDPEKTEWERRKRFDFVTDLKFFNENFKSIVCVNVDCERMTDHLFEWRRNWNAAEGRRRKYWPLIQVLYPHEWFLVRGTDSSCCSPRYLHVYNRYEWCKQAQI